MNTQYQQDALDVMKELCNNLTSNTAKQCQQTAAMQNEVSVQTGYTQQCVVINDLFRMTGDENYSLYNIMHPIFFACVLSFENIFVPLCH